MDEERLCFSELATSRHRAPNIGRKCTKRLEAAAV